MTSGVSRVVGTVLLLAMYTAYIQRGTGGHTTGQEPPIGPRTLFPCPAVAARDYGRTPSRKTIRKTKTGGSQGRCANGDTIIFLLSIQLYNMASFLRPSKADTKHACAVSRARAVHDLSPVTRTRRSMRPLSSTTAYYVVVVGEGMAE